MLMRTGGVQKAEVAWFISSSEAVKGSDAIGRAEALGRIRALTFASLLATALLMPAIPAWANLNCTGTSLWCPEGASQRYWVAPSVTSSWANSVTNDISHDLQPTDLVTTIVSSHANSDVHIELVGTPLQNNSYGWYTCPDPAGDICRHWHITLTTYDYPGDGEATPYASAHRDWVSCLELGHTSGLEHNPNNNVNDPSCMYNSNVVHNRHLNTHDRNHINATV